MIYIVHHSNDLDGFFSGLQLAFAAHVANEKFITVPYNYQEELRVGSSSLFDIVESGDTVVFTDCFYKPKKWSDEECIVQYTLLNKNGVYLRLIDHHETSINFVKENMPFFESEYSGVKFSDVVEDANDEKISAAMLCMMSDLENLAVNMEVISLISDYDTFDNANREEWDNHILPFQYGMRAASDLVDMFNICESGLYKKMVANKGNMDIDIYDIERQGLAIMSYIESRNKIVGRNIIKGECHLISGDEETVYSNCAIVADYCNNSLLFEQNLKEEYNNYDLLILARPNLLDRENTNVSIISPRGEPNAAEICAKFGGGGHKGIGGCTVKLSFDDSEGYMKIILK